MTLFISPTRSAHVGTGMSAPSGKREAAGTDRATASANAVPATTVTRGSPLSRNPATGVLTTGRPTARYS